MANTLHLAEHVGTGLSPGDPGYDAFDDLWSRLARPMEVASTVSALVGLPIKEVQQLAGIKIAASPEADELLDAFPHTIRSLATSMHSQAERCIGSLRGPILWSETIAARAASFGNPDVFVCQTPSRAYDIDENRVLVWAIVQVRDAAERATEGTSSRYDDRVMKAVRRNGNDAARFAEHPSLSGVTRERPKLRALKRTRSGRKRDAYMPALKALDRAAEPLTAQDVRLLCDERTRVQHEVLMKLCHRLERHGNRLPEFRIERGALYSGPVQYYHSRRLGDRERMSGIVIGNLLLDVPDRIHDPSRARAEALLHARAGGRKIAVVMNDADIDAAVAQAIELARGRV